MTAERRQLLLVGTRKGAFVLTSDDGRRSWKASGPLFKGNEIYHMVYDGRNGLLLAGVNSEQWGPGVTRSFDLGKTWKRSETPPRFPKGSGLSVSRIWHIEPEIEDEPDVLFLGVAPACLFRSDDKGVSWSVNEALMNHRTRRRWQPGAGGLCLHTILTDESDQRKMHIAISAVGTLFTEDGGRTWEFQNNHVLADYLPKKYPVFGQCVHKLARHPERRNKIYQQNHCGVYRSSNSGKDWTDVRNNLPSRFGFPIAVNANDHRRVYVAPLEADSSRVAPDGHFAVWTSDNSGNEWFPLDRGFPKLSYFTVLREGMVSDREDPCGLYVGTTTGQLFASRDQGQTWEKITDGLPPILSLSVSNTLHPASHLITEPMDKPARVVKSTVQTLPLLVGALLVGVFHMSAPDHWVTLCILGRISNWSRLRLLGASIVTGLGHVLLSVTLGFAIVALGFVFSESISLYVTEITGGLMLLLGLTYGVSAILSDKAEDYQKEAEYKFLHRKREAERGVGYFAVLGAALSPDLSVLPVFLLAIPVGLGLAVDTAIVYALGSILSLALLVLAASYGLAKAFERMPPKYNDASVGFVIAAIGAYILISG